ncbi:hypothetical protein QJS04_geneDACA003552 [Acorus gramineus]|uniref:Uncharacterized protein n=1 Tax=Acorus gramineus TaxID=55184 RepID=A0AAV9BPP5_ACOGR|nr:hypothetical protein QJS04_geneDACA003552 [Acorus gramineus]
MTSPSRALSRRNRVTAVIRRGNLIDLNEKLSSSVSLSKEVSDLIDRIVSDLCFSPGKGLRGRFREV